MKRLQQAEACADMLAKSRAEFGVSAKKMAMSIGVTEKTIRNWEDGQGAPTVVQLLRWFETLDANPLRWILTFIHPDIYTGRAADASDNDINTALLHYLSNIATAQEKRMLSFLIFGKHGSSWNAMLNEFVANAHCDMYDRFLVAQIVCRNYLMAEKQKSLNCPESVRPNMEVLQSAIESGWKAAADGKSGYMPAK